MDTPKTQADKNISTYIEAELSAFAHFNRKKPEGFYYGSTSDFLRQEGRFYREKTLTFAEKNIVESAIRNLGFTPQIKQCYYNSQLLVMNDFSNTLRYCEGYGMSIIPVLHGWCEINNKVIDLTWKNKKGNYAIGRFPKDRAYFGISFNTPDIRARILKSGMASTMIDDWQKDFPLMKKKFVHSKGVMSPQTKS